MSLETVPGIDIDYHLVAFDAHGRERAESGEMYSRKVLDEAKNIKPTDVFLFSHGWNADIPAARSQYGRWLTAMASCAADRARMAEKPGGYRPLSVGLHWPSKAWSDEQLPQDAADAAPAAPDGPGAGVEWLVDHYAAALTDTPTTREALRTILESALQDAAPLTLPEHVKRAYEVIDLESGASNEGVGAAPGDDRDSFDAEASYEACQVEELASFGDFSLGGVLAPLRVLTFWQMKRRARIFGEGGASTLLGDLQAAAPTARFHLMGHSFGCIVVSAAVSRSAGSAGVLRPVDTLALVQGAMSLWSFCSRMPPRPDRPGYFHRVVGDGLVRGPVLTTTSVHDRAVRVFYPLGARVKHQVAFVPDELPTYGGIGTFGVCGPGVDTVNEVLGPVDTDYGFKPHKVYNLDADGVINSGGGASGAHSDICHPPVAHAIWQAVASANGDPA